MGKFLIGIVVGVVVTVLGIVVVAFAMAKLFESKKPSIDGDSVLVLNLDGDIPEVASVTVWLPSLQEQGTPPLQDIWSSLHAAVSDPRIKAVVFAPHGLTAGWGKLEELHQQILDFKKSGKPVYALLAGGGSREYYVASAADRIYISPDDLLDVKGFRVETFFVKDALAKLGVQFQVDHIGRFKDAGDMFTRTDMTPETHQVLSEILDQIYNDFCTTVGHGRHKTPDQMRALIDAGPFLSQAAKDNGLIDVVGYEDQLFSDLKQHLGLSDLKKLDIRTYVRAQDHKGDRIAYLVASGDIVRGSSDSTASSDIIASGAITKVIRQVRDDSSVKAVILRVDSPGGDATASDEILHEMKLLSQKKPLIISFSDVAASGGYFMSMTGDPIVSYPDTLTGSIGVLYTRPNIHGLLDKIGIQDDEITRGRLADIDSLTNPLSDAGQQKLHDMIESTYHLFVSNVAQARKKSYDQIDPLAQGRVWTGAEARGNDLIDNLGGIDEAVALIRQRAKLPANGETDLITYPPKRTWLEALAQFGSNQSAEAAVDRKIRAVLPGLPSRSLLHGGLQQVLPYRITVH